MAWILRNSGYEERNGKVERVASQTNTNVYLEAVEVAEDEGYQPEKARNARLVGIQKREHSQRLLGCRRQYASFRHHK